MATKLDPDGQSDVHNGNVFGLKRYLLQKITLLKREIANAERLIHAQPEIINDATRALVLRELVDEIKRSVGNYRYDAGYEEMAGRADTAKGLLDEASRLENWANYLENYGWVKKYLPDGSPKIPTLEDKIDYAYIRGGAQEILKLMTK